MKIFRIAAALVLAALLTGCSGGSIYSNYRELEQLMVIQTMGFDWAESGVRLSASSGSDSAGGGGGRAYHCRKARRSANKIQL